MWSEATPRHLTTFIIASHCCNVLVIVCLGPKEQTQMAEWWRKAEKRPRGGWQKVTPLRAAREMLVLSQAEQTGEDWLEDWGMYAQADELEWRQLWIIRQVYSDRKPHPHTHTDKGTGNTMEPGNQNESWVELWKSWPSVYDHCSKKIVVPQVLLLRDTPRPKKRKKVTPAVVASVTSASGWAIWMFQRIDEVCQLTASAAKHLCFIIVRSAPLKRAGMGGSACQQGLKRNTEDYFLLKQ